jgi:hypothetical protein
MQYRTPRSLLTVVSHGMLLPCWPYCIKCTIQEFLMLHINGPCIPEPFDGRAGLVVCEGSYSCGAKTSGPTA